MCAWSYLNPGPCISVRVARAVPAPSPASSGKEPLAEVLRLGLLIWQLCCESRKLATAGRAISVAGRGESQAVLWSIKGEPAIKLPALRKRQLTLLFVITFPDAGQPWLTDSRERIRLGNCYSKQAPVGEERGGDVTLPISIVT